MKLFAKHVLLFTQAVFAGQAMAVETIFNSVATAGARTFTLISQKGEAKVFEGTKLLYTLRQNADYNLYINRDGAIKLRPPYAKGNHGTDVAFIKKIYNPYGYNVKVTLKDKGPGVNFVDKTIPAGESNFNAAIPWDQDNNVFTLTVDVNPKPLVFPVLYDLISQKGVAVVRLSDGQILESGPQTVAYDIYVSADGMLSLKGVNYISTDVAYIRRIRNDSSHKLTAKLQDKGKKQDFIKTIEPDTEDLFERNIPWDQDGNYFTLTLE